jgi:predicted O-linked N-acetylglucosamine transferase (SPINDLY family)
MSAADHFQAALQFHQAGKSREAEDAYRRAIFADGAHVDAWQRLGILLHQSGRTGEAIDALRRAAELGPGAADVHNNLGAVLAAAGHLPEALNAFASAVSLCANFPETHNNIANLLRQLGRTREAVSAYRRAVRLRPDYPDAWNSLGTLARIEGDLDTALDALDHAVRLRPDWPEALNNLAGVYQEMRKLDHAVHLFRRALSFKSEPRIWDNLLLALYGLPSVTAQNLRDEHARWNQAVPAPMQPTAPSFSNDRSPSRGLRIGYVSPDFREHPVGRLMTPVLANHDRSRFEVFCYSDVKAPDAITARHRSHADHWIDATAMTDDQLAAKIREDRIDVLIDLALHTANNRLLVFARRPAPVQMAWAGYPGSTGLSTMDFRITDPQLDPPDSGRESLYPEKLIRLPHCFWCFDPYEPDPHVNPLPARRNGFFTFGCLNQFAKISDPTLVRWSAVLNAVPHSRLHVLAPAGRARAEFANFMAYRGITPDRISFLDRRPRPDYLKLYHDIDIVLDTSPYTGHTTTLDALYMGVPVVTLPGETAVSRGGLSILAQVGLPELVAPDDTTFTRIATTLAQTPDYLATLRSTLRPRLMSSPLADTVRFTRDMESAIRTAWRLWCGAA